MSVLAQLDPDQGGGAGRVLYIDTEGTFRPDRVKQIAEARGYMGDGVQDNILVARCYTVDHLQQLLSEGELSCFMFL